MADTELASIAEAEKLRNRTLVYQAAVAVHELKDRLNLDVAELRLVVAPASAEAPGSYRVTCTIASLTEPKPVEVDVLVRPEQAIASMGNSTKAASGRQQAKPAARGRVRRSRG
jgi:hypothetical protein